MRRSNWCGITICGRNARASGKTGCRNWPPLSRECHRQIAENDKTKNRDTRAEYMIDVAHYARVDMAMKDAHNGREGEPPHRGPANHPNDCHRRVDERGAAAGQT